MGEERLALPPRMLLALEGRGACPRSRNSASETAAVVQALQCPLLRIARQFFLYRFKLPTCAFFFPSFVRRGLGIAPATRHPSLADGLGRHSWRTRLCRWHRELGVRSLSKALSSRCGAWSS